MGIAVGDPDAIQVVDADTVAVKDLGRSVAEEKLALRSDDRNEGP